MQRNEEDVLLITEPQQCSAQEWSFSQVKRKSCFAPCSPQQVRVSFRLGKWRQINDRNFHLLHFGDDRYGLAHSIPESRAYGLVSSDDFIHALLERCNVEPADHAHGDRHVVGDTVRLKLIEKPETMLRKRKAGLRRVRSSLDFRKLQTTSILKFCAHALGQAGYGGSFKQTTQRHFHSE